MRPAPTAHHDAFSLTPACQRALRELTISPCVKLLPSLLTYCRPVTLARPKRDPPGPEEQLYGTWQPKGSCFFTLLRDPSGETLIYCHENDTLYHAAPEVQMAQEAPKDIALLTQWCEDRVAGTTRVDPHLLVMDALHTREVRPHVRGAYVRSIAHLLPKPVCLVQWGGNVHTLKGFTHTLPHEVAATLVHTRNPAVLARYTAIQ